MTTDRQPRERPVPCGVCRRDTWNLGRTCDRCLDEEAAAADERGAHQQEIEQHEREQAA